ncbi:MAG: hypothetical protein ACFFCH_09625 [Promethearchaeota archaeon]
MAYENYVKLLSFWGAIIAIIVALISIAYYGITIAISLPWLGPLWLLGIGGSMVSIVLDVIALICAFLVWRKYVPMLETNYAATAIPLIILGILSWVAFGGLLIFIAGILVFLDKENVKA